MLEIIQHGSVRELRLSRAPVNALNTELISALDAAIALAETEAAAGASLRALVISGNPKLFSAGLDLREITGPGDLAQIETRGEQLGIARDHERTQRSARCSLCFGERDRRIECADQFGVQSVDRRSRETQFTHAAVLDDLKHRRTP